MFFFIYLYSDFHSLFFEEKKVIANFRELVIIFEKEFTNLYLR